MEKCKCDVPGHCPWRKELTTKAVYEQCQQTGYDPNGTPSNPCCLYLGGETQNNKIGTGYPIHQCALYDECVLIGSDASRAHNLRSCDRCSSFLPSDKKIDPDTWRDPLLIRTADGKRTDIFRNFLKGGAAFLVCGGPSLRELPYGALNDRGVFSLGVNNVAGYARCAAFVCSDPPMKFHSSIFYDPKIIKFLPVPKLKKNRGKLRRKVGNIFTETGDITADCPNTFGFERRSWLSCDRTWFTETSAAWGNHNQGLDKLNLTSDDKTVNTMFLGLRILQYLGARKVFLLGVDFHMDPTKDVRDNYSFGEHRDDGACRSNNNQYRVANRWFTELRPVFEEFGFRTYNCNQYSRLTAFDYVPFNVALEIVRGKTEPEPYDLEGWYKK